MKRVLVTAVIASGCDVVFSLDRPPADAPAPEPGPDEVTARFRRAVLPEAGGTVSLESAPEVTATVVLANGARPEVTRDGDNFRFAWTRGTTYQITFDRGDRPPVTYAMSSEHLEIADPELARAGTTPSPGSRLDVTFQNVGTPVSLFLISTGVWSISGNDGSVSTLNVDWTNPDIFLSRRPRLLDERDDVYCLHYERVTESAGTGGLTYNTIKRASASSVTMNDATPTTLTCLMSNLVLTDCARMEVDLEQERARVTQALTTGFGEQWSWGSFVIAVPSEELGPWHSPAITYEYGTGSTATPFIGQTHYKSPFIGHSPAVHSFMTRQRFVLAEDDATRIDLMAGTRQFYAAPPSCGAYELLAEISMPSPPAFGGVVLVNDGEVQLTDSEPIEVSWTDRTPGPVDYYLVTLHELVAESGVSKLPERHSWVTTNKSILIDPGVFAVNHKYILEVVSNYGWANTAEGDFYTTRWPAPVASGTNFSGVFTVKQ